ncbi:hypothetical protein [Deinococcus radiotolerans]|uniref:Uncharacterized protein n=1 Tax=Deinococcus radiotolerans TaxID=1309407 RepID=A0ABQ2FQI5_9DEIO|nr:hypothetical protein [Deinococcus radiotolerans]GGL17028.1 hypothetical protein GCM10010844_39900 [Deinococcus radiotolerans]
METFLLHPDQSLNFLARNTGLLLLCLGMIAISCGLLHGMYRTRLQPGGTWMAYGAGAITMSVLTMIVWVTSGLNVVAGLIGLLCIVGFIVKVVVDAPPRRRARY